MPEPDHLLRICRAAMPSAAGVVLATPDGRRVAHEPDRVREPDALAREAAAAAHAPTSALVPRPDGLYLVVFVPDDPLVSWGAAALPAA